MRAFIVLIITFATVVLLTGSSSGEFDALQLSLLRQYDTPVRWDNVESEPEWMSGQRPYRDAAAGLHFVELAPGMEVSVRLPAEEFIRVRGSDEELLRGGLNFYVSNGTGMLVQALPLESSTEGSLVLRNPNQAPVIITLIRPAVYETSLNVALFISRREAPAEIAPYRELVKLPGDPVRLRHKGGGSRERYWHLMPDIPHTVTVEGPGRFSIEHRAVYPGEESSRLLSYRVFVRIDGRLQNVMEYETKPETSRLLMVEGEPQILGRDRRGYFELPEGKHELSLEGTSELYLRLLRQQDPDYLFPDINAAHSVEDHREALAGVSWRASYWNAMPVKLNDSVKELAGAAMFAKQALKLALDNERPGGGMIAAEALNAAAESRPDFPGYKQLAQDIRGTYTFYRPMYPVEKNTPADQVFKWFELSSLREPDQGIFGNVAAEQHTKELADFLKGGYFVSIPSGTDLRTRYIVPKNRVPGSLLLAAEAMPGYAGAEFMLQAGSSEPVRISLRPEHILRRNNFLVSGAETGLELLGMQHSRTEPATLSGAFSAGHYPAHIAPVYSGELVISPDTGEIKIWRIDGAVQPLKLALFYRAARHSIINESGYLEALHGSGYKADRLKIFADELSGAVQKRLSGEELLHINEELAFRDLRNYRSDMIRLIRNAATAYAASVSPESEEISAVTDMNSDRDAELRLEAYRAVEAGQWLIAAEIWAEILASDGRASDEEALFQRVQALLKLDEEFLAFNMLKGLLIFSEDSVISERAAMELESLYIAKGDTGALFSLYSYLLTNKTDARIFRKLAILMHELGNPEMALAAALVLPEDMQPVETVLRASFSAGWWKTYQETLSRLPLKKRSIWEALDLARRGRYEEASAVFSAGGEQGQKFAAALDRGIDIMNGLHSYSLDERLAAISEWEIWEQGHPGLRIWRLEPFLIQDYASSAPIYNIARDLYSQAFMAENSNPVRLRVQGPADLKIELRPLHAAGSPEPLNGWISISEEGYKNDIAVINNFPQHTLKLIGNDEMTPGRKIESLLSVGPGMHEITVTSAQLHTLVRVFGYRPETRLPVLPELTPATVHAAREGLYHTEVLGKPECLRLQMQDCIIMVSRDRDGAADINYRTRSAKGRGFAYRVDDQAYRLTEDSRQSSSDIPRTAEEIIMQNAGHIVQRAQSSPGEVLAALIELEELYENNPEVKGLVPLLKDIRGRTMWGKVRSVSSSAGFRGLDYIGWRPESPLIRIRKTLLQRADLNEHFIYGSDSLVLVSRDEDPHEMELVLKVEDIPYLNPEGMLATYQVDDGEVRAVMLTQEMPVFRTRTLLPPGEHYLRVRAVQQFSNQFLRVQVYESGSAGAGERFKVGNEGRRIYHVATDDEPVKTAHEGPAIIRVDRLKEGRVISEYHQVRQGVETIIVKPEENEGEVLVRIYRRNIKDEQTSKLTRFAVSSVSGISRPLVEGVYPLEASGVRLQDGLAAAGQEDGTLSP
ncbi:hypothetical protein H8E50_04225, partial [bacterium]|nr:hypothetical protein [bacterium]